MIRLEQVGLTTADFKSPRVPSIALPILQHISLQFAPQQIVGIVGPTGAGKSCLLKLLNRLVDPSAGYLSWRGTAYSEIPVQQLRRQIVLVAQEPKLLGMPVAEAIVYGLKLRGQSDVQLRTALQQWQARLQIPSAWLDQSEAALSVGQRQWVALTRGIACEPEVLLLDEPTAYLGGDYAARLQNVLRKLMAHSTQTIVIVTHDWDWLKPLCDRVVYLEQGQVVQDSSSRAIDWSKLASQVANHNQAIEAEWS